MRVLLRTCASWILWITGVSVRLQVGTYVESSMTRLFGRVKNGVDKTKWCTGGLESPVVCLFSCCCPLSSMTSISGISMVQPLPQWKIQYLLGIMLDKSTSTSCVSVWASYVGYKHYHLLCNCMSLSYHLDMEIGGFCYWSFSCTLLSTELHSVEYWWWLHFPFQGQKFDISWSTWPILLVLLLWNSLIIIQDIVMKLLVSYWWPWGVLFWAVYLHNCSRWAAPRTALFPDWMNSSQTKIKLATTHKLNS